MTLKPSLVAALAAGLLLTGCGKSEPGQQETMNQEPMQQQAPADETSASQADETSASQAASTDGDAMNGPSAEVPEPIAAAVANTDRPDEDTARDADRRPGQVLAFVGVQPGMDVLEFVAAGGYYTEILSRAVGDNGHVYATRLDDKRIADNRLPNVTAVGDQDWGLEPGSVGLVFTALNYHDLFNVEGLDRNALLKRFYDVLKPGGTFAVVDHAAQPGSGSRDTNTLHRVDEQTVVSEITGAGFELVDESDVLRHPEDDHTRKVFDEGIRGKTDRFVLKFIKPAA